MSVFFTHILYQWRKFKEKFKEKIKMKKKKNGSKKITQLFSIKPLAVRSQKKNYDQL